MSGTPLNLEHVAHLARIRLTPAEAAHFGPQLAEILTYVDQMQSLDTEAIEATFQVMPVTNVLREDEIRPSGMTREEALSNAPQSENGFFRVPRIL